MNLSNLDKLEFIEIPYNEVLSHLKKGYSICNYKPSIKKSKDTNTPIKTPVLVFYTKQIPNTVPNHIIKNMTSLPQDAKNILTTLETDIKFDNQYLIIRDNYATYADLALLTTKLLEEKNNKTRWYRIETKKEITFGKQLDVNIPNTNDKEDNNRLNFKTISDKVVIKNETPILPS